MTTDELAIALRHAPSAVHSVTGDGFGSVGDGLGTTIKFSDGMTLSIFYWRLIQRENGLSSFDQGEALGGPLVDAVAELAATITGHALDGIDLHRETRDWCSDNSVTIDDHRIGTTGQVSRWPRLPKRNFGHEVLKEWGKLG